ncbi:amidase domain-containing protein [Anoxybacteroides tepidamans]|uniref:amidase domain-containing protein n=1 Tax=Anoxybacteroides tepidamans TaxID=265948 RepID=UPI00048A1E83|nr:amidase domain-containing protein [Anoxybacillus tepidamans]
MKNQLEKLFEKRAQSFVSLIRNVKDEEVEEVIEKKLQLFRKRDAEIVKCIIKGQVLRKQQVGERTAIDYVVHYQFLVEQHEWMYVEEQVEKRRAHFNGKELIEDKKIEMTGVLEPNARIEYEAPQREKVAYVYDRIKAVQYAETWWNSYNPKFPKFSVDCTNFISQCLYAGGVPMVGYPNRSKGWWMKNGSWSYSWTVANAFRWYLSGNHIGLQAIEVSSPEKLVPGDVICYDFQGDGRFDHSTIVVAKDQKGMPLVNAHTTNSRMRYWSYEDSTAYTPNIQYKFFHIVDKE